MTTRNLTRRGVLLLNGNYTPIRIISIRKAVELMLRKTVTAVDGVAAVLRTPSSDFTVPSILRLKVYTSVPDKRVRVNKRNVLRRDNYTCGYCGVTVEEIGKDKLTVDHIKPRARGGKDTWGNLITACWPCNHRKGAKFPHEAGMKLRWEPKTPRTNYLVIGGNIPEEWKIYVKVK